MYLKAFFEVYKVLGKLGIKPKDVIGMGGDVVKMGKSLFNTRPNPKLLQYIEKNQKIPTKIVEELKIHARTLKNATENQVKLFEANLKDLLKAKTPKMPIKSQSPVTGVQRPATSGRQLPEWTKGWTPRVIKGGKDGLATGGISNHFKERVGLKDGKGIISQTGIPYYADKALEGIVHSAETLSKLPFAGGKLISNLLRSPPNKKMFTEALEEIQPGSWSSKIGLNDLIVKEEKNLPQSVKNVGNVLGLGTEIAVPVGAALKVGNTILKNVSKSFGKSKKGKTLEQVVDKQLTAFGQSRRDFNIMAGTSGLMVALKSIGLGGLGTKVAKLGDDIKVSMRSDADYSYEGPESGWEGGTWTDVSFEPLTKAGVKILDSLVKAKQIVKDKVAGYRSNTSEDALTAVEKIKNKKGKMQVETPVREKTKGAVKGEFESTKIYQGEDIHKIIDESDYLVNDMGGYAKPQFFDEFTGDILDVISPKKVTKAEGGIANHFRTK